jgi:hypothetical protein
VDGTRYTFDVSGLYNGVFAMRDRQTGSLWTHYGGTVLSGPLVDASGQTIRLDIIPLVHTAWGAWRALHPGTLVLDWDPSVADRYHLNLEPGDAYLGDDFQRTVLHWDDRLPSNELVLGVNIGGHSRAYVLSDLGPGSVAINDLLAGIPVVVFGHRDTHSALAFLATVDGRILDFEAEGGQITDSAGSTWSLTGQAIAGPLVGTQLSFAPSLVTEWYGWAAYHPDTDIHGRDGQ